MWLPIPMYPSPGQELGFPGGHFLCLQLDSMRPALVHGSPRRAFWESLGGAWSLSSHPHWGICCSSEPFLDLCWAVWIRRESVTRTQRARLRWIACLPPLPVPVLEGTLPLLCLAAFSRLQLARNIRGRKVTAPVEFCCSFFLFFPSPRC